MNLRQTTVDAREHLKFVGLPVSNRNIIKIAHYSLTNKVTVERAVFDLVKNEAL